MSNERKGRPPRPIEEKRRLGNIGHRPLPAKGTMVALPGASEPPEPSRPLGREGRALWERIWRAGAVWLAEKVDAEAILIVCEQMDERQALRARVFAENAWRDRLGLRALDDQLMDGLTALGFTPTARARLGVAEVRHGSALDDIISRRQQRTS